MSGPIILSYQGARPALAAGASLAAESAVIGRVRAGRGLTLRRLAVLRADGHDITLGDDCFFAERATCHIADKVFPSIVGARVSVGAYALVHACTVGEDCVIGEQAVVMDGAVVGDGAVIAAGALVPPGKTLDAGMVHAGSPARPLRPVSAEERLRLHAAIRAGNAIDPVAADDLPALESASLRPPGVGPLYPLGGARPILAERVYVAPGAVVAGNVVTARDVSIWFACVLRADGASITIGARSNVQDNSFVLTDAKRGPITIGADVTVGHNVRMGACLIEDRALIGMGSILGDGVVVEQGAMVGARALVEPATVVKAGWIWAGRPAREFRRVKPEEHDYFQRGKDVYVGYTHAYLAEIAA